MTDEFQKFLSTILADPQKPVLVTKDNLGWIKLLESGVGQFRLPWELSGCLLVKVQRNNVGSDSEQATFYWSP